MHLKLKDQQLKTTLLTYRLPYQNLIVTTNQKSAIDTHKRNPNPNTTLKIDIKSQENKRGREEKRPLKTNPKQLTK